VIHRRYTPETITSLCGNAVLVFGTNSTGFHGAGLAGLAFRGTVENNWREDSIFLSALNAPLGSALRIGKWAVLGISRGPMQGREGQSYGIETIRRPGARRSTPLAEILAQLQSFGRWASQRPNLEILCCITGGGYNGWTVEEMREQVYIPWLAGKSTPPLNVLIPREMAPNDPV